MVRPYLSNIINDHNIKREWKIQLTMEINFISSRDSNETHTMYITNNNIEITRGRDADEITDKLFESLLQKYQEGLEEKLKGSDLVFDCVDLLY